MASRMVSSYGPQTAQANEEPPPESSLDLTLTQHPRDEKPELRKVRARFEIEPLRAWYYRISPNFRTLVILLQWRAPKPRGETHSRVSQSQVAESWTW